MGTSMGVSKDAPDLDIAYKLCEYAGKGRLKLSTGKLVLPGRKQVFRMATNDRDLSDVITRADEKLEGRPLLVGVMREGKRLDAGCVDLESARDYAKKQIWRLPDHVRANSPAKQPFPVEVSRALSLLQEKISDEVAAMPRSKGGVK